MRWGNTEFTQRDEVRGPQVINPPTNKFIKKQTLTTTFIRFEGAGVVTERLEKEARKDGRKFRRQWLRGRTL